MRFVGSVDTVISLPVEGLVTRCIWQISKHVLIELSTWGILFTADLVTHTIEHTHICKGLCHHNWMARR